MNQLILKIEMEQIIFYMARIFVQKEEYQIGENVNIYLVILIKTLNCILIVEGHALLQIANYVIMVIVLLVKKVILYLVQLVEEM